MTIPTITNESTVLGCAQEYSVIITGRDLNNYAAELKWSQITWSRVLDEISSASVTVPDKFGGLDCNISLGSELRPWRYGIRIERDGELVWAGPITNISRPVRNGQGADYVTISAQDKMTWMRKRLIKTSQLLSFQDGGSVFRSILLQGTNQDNAFNLTCPNFSTGFTVTRDLLALDFEYVYDLLSDLGNSAVDWFIIGNDLAVLHAPSGISNQWRIGNGGTTQQLAPTPDSFGRYFFGTFTDDSWVARPGYELDGESQANDVFIPGADSGLQGFRRFWTASQANVADGVLSYVDVNPLYRPQEGTPITAVGIFQRRADSLLALRKDTPVVISGGVLSRTAPVTVNNLFPGSLWVIDLTDKGISELVTIQRLKQVDVNVSVNNGSIVENVSPTLMPLGTDESGGDV